jgi:hypothetical protein
VLCAVQNETEWRVCCVLCRIRLSALCIFGSGWLQQCGVCGIDSICPPCVEVEEEEKEEEECSPSSSFFTITLTIVAAVQHMPYTSQLNCCLYKVLSPLCL